MADTNPSAQAERSGTAGQEQKTAAKIDPHKLADKVYRLMQADLRLARARGVDVPQRKER